VVVEVGPVNGDRDMYWARNGLYAQICTIICMKKYQNMHENMQKKKNMHENM